MFGHRRVPQVPRVRRVPRVLGLLALAFASVTEAAPVETTFKVHDRAEVLARITVRCDRCAWDVLGREAVVLRVSLDGRYSQHLPVVRTGRALYEVMLGLLEPGSHTILVEEDPELTSRDLRGTLAVVEPIAFDQIVESLPEHQAIALAPFVYARPDTVGRFTDVPVFMWYESEATARGRRYRYSVIFTNEDGGTPTDRLMATWGRTTDIEYLYGVEVDATGVILAEDFQGPEHEVLPFAGTREGRHPLLWVSTANNMVLDKGITTVRYAPVPEPHALRDMSREAVMDYNPWLYAVMSQELKREDKIVPDAPPEKNTIPDPRRFVYLEACGELSGAALAFAIDAGSTWIPSDRGVREYRIVRDGCFRVAIPVPAPVSARDLRGVRAQAYTRPPGADGSPKTASSVHLSRLNKVFMLDEQYRPGPSLFVWQGALTLVPDGPPVEIPVR